MFLVYNHGRVRGSPRLSSNHVQHPVFLVRHRRQRCLGNTSSADLSGRDDLQLEPGQAIGSVRELGLKSTRRGRQPQEEEESDFFG